LKVKKAKKEEVAIEVEVATEVVAVAIEKE
jgi:hypothetical protein